MDAENTERLLAHVEAMTGLLARIASDAKHTFLAVAALLDDEQREELDLSIKRHMIATERRYQAEDTLAKFLDDLENLPTTTKDN